VVEAAAKTSQTQDQLVKTGDEAKALDKRVDAGVDQAIASDEKEAKEQSRKIKQALQVVDPTGASNTAASDQREDKTGDSGGSPSSNVTPTAQQPEVQSVQRQKGRLGRAAHWFSAKLGGIKAGVRRLNAKIIAGVLKYAAKFSKSEAERDAAMAGLAEEQAFVAKNVQEETENDGLFTAFQEKATQLKTGVTTLAEQEK
jgi:hypothetical protein